MGLRLIAPPLVEPVTIAEQKAFMRVDIPDEDALVAAFITAARQAAEAITGRAFVTQQWKATFDIIPIGKRIELPVAPVVSVESVSLADDNGVLHALDASAYHADLVSEPARITLHTYSRPLRWRHRINVAEVVFTCGYGADGASVPEPLKLAVRFMAAHFHENRAAVSDAANIRFEELPMGVRYLLAPYRLWGRHL
ncbi:MAG: head-tail connector protein [Elusimicrobiales bacterium]|nr:head-tail connector protein [Elusimicrobiales bacterium]